MSVSARVEVVQREAMVKDQRVVAAFGALGSSVHVQAWFSQLRLTKPSPGVC